MRRKDKTREEKESERQAEIEEGNQKYEMTRKQKKKELESHMRQLQEKT